MLSVQRRVNGEQDYGYLIWRRMYQTSCGPMPAWYMAGNGGNAVVIMPARNLVVVVTRTAYNTPGMHQQTTRLLEERVLPAVLCAS
jgi:CubicO group peptidase (beta-lactamase class C family)